MDPIHIRGKDGHEEATFFYHNQKIKESGTNPYKRQTIESMFPGRLVCKRLGFFQD
jgi:hypothetical protein